MKNFFIITAFIVISCNQQLICDVDWFGSEEDTKTEKKEQDKKPETREKKDNEDGSDWFGAAEDKQEAKVIKKEDEPAEKTTHWEEGVTAKSDKKEVPAVAKKETADSWFSKPEDSIEKKPESTVSSSSKKDIAEEKEKESTAIKSKENEDFFTDTPEEKNTSENKAIAENKEEIQTKSSGTKDNITSISENDQNKAEELQKTPKKEIPLETKASELLKTEGMKIKEEISNPEVNQKITATTAAENLFDEKHREIRKVKDNASKTIDKAEPSEITGKKEEAETSTETFDKEAQKPINKIQEKTGKTAVNIEPPSLKTKEKTKKQNAAITAIKESVKTSNENIKILKKITLSSDNSLLEKITEKGLSPDRKSVAEKKIITSEPVRKVPVYNYKKDPDLTDNTANETAEPDNSTARLKNSTNLNEAEIVKASSDLENPLNEISNRAKDLLIKAGSDGAKEAVKYLNNENRLAVIKAIIVIREVGDKEVGAGLLPLLDSESPSVRYHANLALKTIYNRNFNFHYDAGINDRKKSSEKWDNFISKLLGKKATPENNKWD